MCGRFTSSTPPAVLAERFRVSAPVAETLVENYNVAPTTKVYAVLDRPEGREMRALRWGLVPSWAKDVKIGAKMINARGETVAEKPAFKRLLARKRCIVPADGYYEWMAQPGKGKQPFYIRHRDGSGMAFAGLYELWRDPAEPDGEPLWSCTVVTTAANDALRHIHDRMPVVLPEHRWDEWLDAGRQEVDELTGLLVPAPAEMFEAFPVSTAVNTVRNKGPELIMPVPLEVSLF